MAVPAVVMAAVVVVLAVVVVGVVSPLSFYRPSATVLQSVDKTSMVDIADARNDSKTRIILKGGNKITE